MGKREKGKWRKGRKDNPFHFPLYALFSIGALSGKEQHDSCTIGNKSNFLSLRSVGEKSYYRKERFMRKALVFSSFWMIVSAVLFLVPTPSVAQWWNYTPGYGDDYPYRDYDRGRERHVVRCESENFDFKQCPVQTDGQVRLTRQLSDTQCRRGQNWGYNNRGIWVDSGCAAEFRVGGRYAGGYGDRRNDRLDRRGRWDRTIRCESEGFEFNRCPAPQVSDARVARQLSDTQCRRGQNWGLDRRGIWVDDGCAAEFDVDDRYAYDNYGR